MKNCFDVQIIITKTYEVIARSKAAAIRKVKFIQDNDTNFVVSCSRPTILNQRQVKN